MNFSKHKGKTGSWDSKLCIKGREKLIQLCIWSFLHLCQTFLTENSYVLFALQISVSNFISPLALD